MICPECNHQMYLDDVLTNRTIDPTEDDTWEKMWVCENCNNVEDIISSDDE